MFSVKTGVFSLARHGSEQSLTVPARMDYTARRKHILILFYNAWFVMRGKEYADNNRENGQREN